ncbi:MAG: PIG-L family deacetylase [Proteobacteria bacterium]|nr:PIG-L family deacetylase [Pseudomonadota bacterium]
MSHITAIGAHPDDIEIFMYGLLAACQARGDTLTLIIATDGAAGHDAEASTTAKALAKKRQEETTRALAPLGKPILLGLGDGQLAHDPNAFRAILAVLKATPADLVVTHDPNDYHPDHRALSQLVANAIGFRSPLLYADTLLGVDFTPQFYVDITPYMPAKEQAIMAHASQDPTRFVTATRLHNQFRAAQMNAPIAKGHYVECYRSGGRFPFADVRGLLPPPPPLRPFYVVGGPGLI